MTGIHLIKMRMVDLMGIAARQDLEIKVTTNVFDGEWDTSISVNKAVKQLISERKMVATRFFETTDPSQKDHFVELFQQYTDDIGKLIGI